MALDLFDKIFDLKDKFQKLFKHKKKLQALENYAQVNVFHHKDYLFLIKKCLSCGFIGPEEGRFLSHMVDTYFINYHYLDWTHKTNWLKKEMDKLAHQYATHKSAQLEINFGKAFKAPHLPLESLTKAQQFFRSKRM